MEANKSWMELRREQFEAVQVGKSYRFGDRIGRVLAKAEGTIPMVYVRWK